ncbi:MAG: hypothetical protein GKC10_06885 [Methanosarcinales archaeon]|nr:hypothetical protein [Methanosarcinales archaeon]
MVVMLLFVAIVQILALALMPPLLAAEVRVFEDPSSTTNPLSYILLVLAFTAFLLFAVKMGRAWVVSGFIQLAVAMSIYYVLSAIIPAVPSILLALGLTAALRFYPEWYLVDAVGLLVSAGVSALFGISMNTLPAVLLLVALAVYDAISVYKTKHMVDLAESAIRMKAPLLFIAPRRRGYSFRKNHSGTEKGGAYFLGLGDAIIPTVIVISANWSVEASLLPIPGLALNLPALGGMLGTVLGFLVLSMTSRSRPQAGLPFLNGGAILGFLLGCAAAGVSPF